MNEFEKRIEILYKERFGQLISLMLQRFRHLSIDWAEDVVQETFTAAAVHWPNAGMPENPSGWLYQTCKNKSINLLKKISKTADLSLAKAVSVAADEISEDGFKDAQLRMLMACCHPHLTPKTQVVLALRYVANLKVENIALQFGAEPDAIEKMLCRARQKIKSESLFSSGRLYSYSADRLSVMHKVIYLIFNEGYKQSGDKISQGKIMCEDALMLNKFLFDSPLCNPETKALQALMLFNVARFNARFDAQGDAVELEYQDRELWDRSLIQLAGFLLTESEDSIFSPYHLEAAIACVHCAARKFEDTDWEAICKYYDVLLKVYPSPFAEINYAVALQYNHQNEKAFRILMDLHRNPYYNKLPILDMTIRKYNERVKSKNYEID
ncbi:MAG TPA: sigma-70 family RNA polymerase sigma factor [Puia sp.]|jgi:RNA polymerase sigma-70 factor (ECF subfamily)|nr:sigma-70 family RNA polymerase sigma factor [Puia sp.]